MGLRYVQAGFHTLSTEEAALQARACTLRIVRGGEAHIDLAIAARGVYEDRLHSAMSLTFCTHIFAEINVPMRLCLFSWVKHVTK